MSRDWRTALPALALGLVLALPVPAAFAHGSHHTSVGKPDKVAASPDGATLPSDPEMASANALDLALALPSGPAPSGIAERITDWIVATDDNGDLPFMIVDKLGARVFAFDSAGEFLGSAPALVGLARGDDSAAGIGGLKLAEMSDSERTTPAGRFVAGFGASAGHGTMLWVDFQDAIAMHPVMSVSPGEHRLRRIKSSDPQAHRISYGCINVPKTFYKDVVLAALAGGNAIVYVLPDTKPIGAVFPVFAAATEPPSQKVTSADPLSDEPETIPEF